MPSILESIRLVAGKSTKVTYAKGCTVRGDDRSVMQEAVAVAKQAEVAVLALGGKSGLDYTCTCGETRDISSLPCPVCSRNFSRRCMPPARRSFW